MQLEQLGELPGELPGADDAEGERTWGNLSGWVSECSAGRARLPGARALPAGLLVLLEKEVDLPVGLGEAAQRRVVGVHVLHDGRHDRGDVGGVVGDREGEGGPVLDLPGEGRYVHAPASGGRDGGLGALAGGGEDDRVLADPLLALVGGEERHPLRRVRLVPCLFRHRVGEPAHHRGTLAARALGRERDPRVHALEIVERTGHPGAAQGQCRLPRPELGLGRVGFGVVPRRGHVALLGQPEIPADGLLEGLLVVVVVLSPGGLSVYRQPAEPVNALHWVCPSRGARVVRRQPVAHHTVLVEAGLVAAPAVGVQRQPGEGLLETAAVRGFHDSELSSLSLSPAFRRDLSVVEETDRVPVLRRAVAVPVLPDPGVREARLVVAGAKMRGGAEFVQRAQHPQLRELRVLGRVVGEDVRLGAREEARHQLRPVVVEADLGDPHRQPGVLPLERLRALLVGGPLVGIPHPVRHGASVRGAPGRLRCAAGAGGCQQTDRAQHPGGPRPARTVLLIRRTPPFT